LGILCFSTPFDETAVDFLEQFNPPAYKIASFENNFHQLLKKVAQTGKPVIMSTGISSLPELSESVQVLRDSGCKELILLKCTSTYPASPADSNLHTIAHMAQLFGCHVGLSDHTMGTGVAVAAVALGARVIEKHFTLSRAEGGVDSAFSLEPDELRSLVLETERAWQALGNISYDILKNEQGSRKFKRSVFVVQDIKKGDTFTRDNIRVIRPGYGLAPKYFDWAIGKTAQQDIKKGTPLTSDLF
jgi:pseudaminic acid synthase